MQQAMQVRRLLTKEAARRRDSDAGSDWIVSGGIVASDSARNKRLQYFEIHSLISY